MLTRRNLRSAFTLLELLIVVMIIGFIAGMVMPQFQAMVEEAKIREAKSVLTAIRGAEKIMKAKINKGTYVGVHIDPGTHPGQDNCPAVGGPCTKADAWDMLSISVDDSSDWSYGANVRNPNDCNDPDGLWGTSDNNQTVIPWARRERGSNAGQVVHIQMTTGDFVPDTGLDADLSVGLDCTQQR